MKKIIIVLLAAAASFTAANKASAQEKGLWIGGKLGYWHDKTEGVKTDSFSIAPEAGYDFNKRWSVGVALGYEYLKVKDGGAPTSSRRRPMPVTNIITRGFCRSSSTAA